VQNRNTAAVAFLRETRSSPPDLMWPSAPDAFDVLEQGNLFAVAACAEARQLAERAQRAR
jgi:hypothetical protein